MLWCVMFCVTFPRYFHKALLDMPRLDLTGMDIAFEDVAYVPLLSTENILHNALVTPLYHTCKTLATLS
jgi:hypothetical protein